MSQFVRDARIAMIYEGANGIQALDLVAKKLLEVKAKGLRDESGYPRTAVTFGSGGIAPAYTGALPAFLGAWGPIDFGIGSGQGVKCYHSEHLYGEFWHRAFTVQSDTPRTKYLVSFGNNNDASGGVLGVWRHAEARAGGMKRVQFEPHLSVTGAHAEWVPLKPKTDAAVMFAMRFAESSSERKFDSSRTAATARMRSRRSVSDDAHPASIAAAISS